jgi:glucosamine-6-phosphate deaminase
MQEQNPEPIAAFTVDHLQVKVYDDRSRMGRAAGRMVSEAIHARKQVADSLHVIFAAAPSQNELLDALAADPGVPWDSVRAFHMDEYLGIEPTHPASFRRYLHEHLFSRVGLKSQTLIPAESTDRPLKICLDYEEALRANPPDVVCAGIGENGHLAFNDPPVADFLDPVRVKVVRLDEACRAQQVHDGCFASLGEVPTHAFTLTVPALLSAPVLAVVVPGPRKAEAVRNTLRGPISESCPASALRRHSGATLFLDRDSAALVL